MLTQTGLDATRTACEEVIHLFLQGSDTLTNEVFAYADTADVKHLTNYWTEADVTKSRDTAVNTLEGKTLSADELDALHNAADASNALMLLETHAMRLIADSAGMSPEEMPQAVAAYALPADEKALPAEEQSALAKELLFGREYMTRKNTIIRNVSDFSYHLNTRIGMAATRNMRHAWIVISVNLGLFILFIILYQFTSNRLDESQREDLRQREECFRIVANQTGRYVFRYAIPTRTYYRITEFPGSTDMPEIIPDLADSATTQKAVNKDSLAAFRGFLNRLDAGETPPDTDIHLLEKNGKTKWYRFSASLVRASDGRAIGAVVSYVECERQREQELAYSRWLQEMQTLDQEKVVLREWNISKDVPDNEYSKVSAAGDLGHIRHFDDFIHAYVKNDVFKEDAPSFRDVVSREKLIGMYHSGVYSHSLDYREVRRDHSLCWMRLTVRLIMYPTSSDIKAYVMIQDINEEKLSALALIQHSELDSLTGAFNRRAFIEKVTELLHKAPQRNHMMLMLDIDGFKNVNDTYGHDFGDKLLQSITQTARRELRTDDLIGRVGGDEFMLCLPNMATDAVMEKKAAQLSRALRGKTPDGGEVTVSIGVSVFSRDGVSFEELYQKADVALYKIKKTCKNGYCFFSPDMETSGNILTSFDR